MDVVQRIKAFDAGRNPELLQVKYASMRESGFAFFRGTAHLFHERLRRDRLTRSAPRVWSCGDLHLENFGSYRAANGLAHFDITDFDQAALAPANWELVRMLASLHVAGDKFDMKRQKARRLCEVFLQAYASALAGGKAYWVEREIAQGLLRTLLDGLRKESAGKLVDERTELRGRKRVLRLDKDKALPVTAAQRKAVTAFMESFAKAQTDPAFFHMLDVAQRVSGLGSLGLERYVVLVRGESRDGNGLLDLKQSRPSSLAGQLKRQPRWLSEAHRVVALQNRLQAAPPAFLQPVLLDERAFVLRSLQPSGDRISLKRVQKPDSDLEQALGTLGSLVAWAQLRSGGREGSAIADELIEFGRLKKWREPLLDDAEDCAEKARRDAATFNAAFDDGAFA
jgi:uncharacterized protein (DUF2252 family)